MALLDRRADSFVNALVGGYFLMTSVLREKGKTTMNIIPYEERAKVYREALETFGTTTQLIVALEELSEVQKEICKTCRGDGNMLHLAEEIADATIMLEQLRQIFDINEEVSEAMDAKVARLGRTIRKEKDRRELRRSFLEKGLAKHFKTEEGASDNDNDKRRS